MSRLGTAIMAGYYVWRGRAVVVNTHLVVNGEAKLEIPKGQGIYWVNSGVHYPKRERTKECGGVV